MFTLTNPSAVTFPRFNADNSVSALNAADFRTAIGAGTGGGSVTSVGGTGTVNGLTLSGTVTTSGSLTLGGTLGSIANSALTNSSISIGGTSISLGGSSSTLANDITVNEITVGRGLNNDLSNVAVGYRVLRATTYEAQANTGVGSGALDVLTSGTYNTGIGNSALSNNLTGSYNTALGAQTLATMTAGSYNTAVGVDALGYAPLTSTHNYNTAVGYRALFSYNVGQQENTAVGANALAASYNIRNTAVGRNAGLELTTGLQNQFFGFNSGAEVTTGSYNVIIGTYGGNTATLDMRTSDNFVVISDGQQNVRLWFNSSGYPFFRSVNSGAGNSTLKWNSTTKEVTYDTSSARYKDNIRDSIYGLSHVMQMRSAQFEYKDSGRSDVGLIAEELDLIVPELVGKNEDAQPESVYYDRMVSVLVKAIQEQQAQIESLTARLNAANL
jgi:hypothetical protein